MGLSLGLSVYAVGPLDLLLRDLRRGDAALEQPVSLIAQNVRILYESLSISLCVNQLLDGKYNLLAVSDGMCAPRGISRAKYLERNAHDPIPFTHPDDVAAILEARACALFHPEGEYQMYTICSNRLPTLSGYPAAVGYRKQWMGRTALRCLYRYNRPQDNKNREGCRNTPPRFSDVKKY